MKQLNSCGEVLRIKFCKSVFLPIKFCILKKFLKITKKYYIVNTTSLCCKRLVFNCAFCNITWLYRKSLSPCMTLPRTSMVGRFSSICCAPGIPISSNLTLSDSCERETTTPTGNHLILILLCRWYSWFRNQSLTFSSSSLLKGFWSASLL